MNQYFVSGRQPASCSLILIMDESTSVCNTALIFSPTTNQSSVGVPENLSRNNLGAFCRDAKLVTYQPPVVQCPSGLGCSKPD